MQKTLITEDQRRAPNGMFLPCIYEHKNEANPRAVREVIQLAEPTNTVAAAKAALVKFAHHGAVRVYDSEGGYHTSTTYVPASKAATTTAPAVVASVRKK